MKALDISRIVQEKPKAVFLAKIAGAVEHIQITGWTKKGVVAVVVKCEAGANWNYDITRGEEIEVLYRSVQVLAFDTHLDFRKDVMKKAEAHGFATHNY
jgi:hypothetical protein